eukprot:CAMPEP_0172791234 /NCGR_PEP_ID=MMETSP1074-20121228/208367_1 /TAXON_ID=2916 /ORGANISM="Ceratium fusus, Strain PA161109" /LENGTH=151 /DNA_ID=CAMNT_0013628291 /DNA_START=277 /DNA_END=732 /DNA_ORIENTATION=-
MTAHEKRHKPTQHSTAQSSFTLHVLAPTAVLQPRCRLPAPSPAAPKKAQADAAQYCSIQFHVACACTNSCSSTSLPLACAVPGCSTTWCPTATIISTGTLSPTSTSTTSTTATTWCCTTTTATSAALELLPDLLPSLGFVFDHVDHLVWQA